MTNGKPTVADRIVSRLRGFTAALEAGLRMTPTEAKIARLKSRVENLERIVRAMQEGK